MLNLLVGNMQPSIGLDFGFAKPLLTLLLCGLQLIVDLKLGIGVNRPGMSGDSSSWKGWGHVRWFIEEVPAGAA